MVTIVPIVGVDYYIIKLLYNINIILYYYVYIILYYVALL